MQVEKEKKREYTPRTIMTLAKRLSSLTLRKELLSLLQSYIEEEELIILQEEESRLAKEAKMNALLQSMEEAGIDITELASAANQKAKNTGRRGARKPRQQKGSADSTLPDVQKN
ncbi:H-NS family histone-like protein [Aeromonas sp. Y311-2]|jgi:hypothetical protein|uniref:H-NS family histone-like protein n=1 Tax=Aeromonas sp. Y311-2 TaxID=2990507 RepID=UPI0022E41F4A|nr:hypothetical protein [Aeromonas sp. Y311-2]